MILRERYMNRIRPFIGSDLIKVMTGMRRSGKSVMMELIREELLSNGVSAEHCITINFEDMRNSHLCTPQALHDEILQRTAGMGGKVYLFFDKIQEVNGWKKCVNSFRVEMDCDIYITGSNAKLLSGELATYLGGRYVEFVHLSLFVSRIYPVVSHGISGSDACSVLPEVSDCRRHALSVQPAL